jgi:hypothetical protein
MLAVKSGIGPPNRLSAPTDRLLRHRRAVYISASVLILLFIANVILEHGDWTRTQEFHGPFEASPTDPGQYSVAIGTDIPFLSIPSPPPAADRAPGEASPVRLWVNGRSWNPPEAPEPSIIQGKFLGIRGLYRVLVFTLPAGIGNQSSTALKVEYQFRTHRSIYEFNFYAAVLMMLLAAALACRSGEWMHARAFLIALMRPLSWAAIAATLFYFGTIVFGLASGDALPTATIFRLIPSARLLALLMPFAPLVLFAFAALGAVLGWSAWVGAAPAGVVRAFEEEQGRLWQLAGLPVLICVLLLMLSSGGWSGTIRSLDMHHMSIGGLVPHSDAAGYFEDTFHLAYFGDWELMGTRRPFAEALRQLVTLAAGYSFSGSLIVQLLLMAGMIYFAAGAMVRCYGIWAGLGFAALAMNIARPYLPTTLTEPLGYVWALFSLIFFLSSVRLRSLPHALVALAALTVALLTRMGALFAIPLVVLWVAFAFGSKIGSRTRAAAAACTVVVAILVVNAALEHLYGARGGGTGSNFAWITCGLSVGMDWNGCSKLYAADFAKLPDELAQSAFLYAKTWENFLSHPGALLGQLWENFIAFIQSLGGFMLAGYIPLYLPTPTEAYATLLPLLPGIWLALRQASLTERSLWVAILASIPPSAAVLMLADGWRLLVVTHLFVAAFLALGLAVPGHRGEPAGTTASWRWQTGAGALGTALIVLLVIPVFAHVLGLRELRRHPPIPPPQAHEEIVTGGRRMTGFLVLADGTPRPRTVPALYASDFVKLIRWTNLEGDFGPFLRDVLPRVPFAFVGAGRLDGPNTTNIYVVPPEVLERKQVWAWRFSTRTWHAGERPWTILQDVVGAEPLP